MRRKVLDEEGVAFVPTATIAPGLANLMALRGRLGLRNSAHTIVKLIDPFAGEGVRICSGSEQTYLDKAREFLENMRFTALLLRSTDGEAFANPKRRPQIEFFHDGQHQILFEAEIGPFRSLPGLPERGGGRRHGGLDSPNHGRKVAHPHPIVNQLACCLYACGYTEDMNQAKAIAAVETGSLGCGVVTLRQRGRD